MRTFVASSASFWIGVALSVGSFHVPQSVALLLLVGGALGYGYVFLTWEPVRLQLARARKERPMLSVIFAALLGAIVFGAGFWALSSPSNDVPSPAPSPPTAAELAAEIAKRLPVPAGSRRLSEWQKVMLASELVRYPSTKVLILVSRGEETLAYANDFKDVFLAANWMPEGPKLVPPELSVMDVRLAADNAGTPRPVILSVLSALRTAQVKSAQRYILDEHIGRDWMVLWVGSQSPDGWSPESIAPIGVPKEFWTRPDGPPEPGDISRPGTASVPKQSSQVASGGPHVPRVALRLVGPTLPSLVIENRSDVVARDIKWAAAIWNQDEPNHLNPLPIPVATFDWINPHKEGGPQQLFSPGIAATLKKGDRLLGSLSVSCPDCTQGGAYIVSIVWGEGGWFGEVQDDTSGDLFVPKDPTHADWSLFFMQLAAQVKPQNRVPIQPWHVKL